MPDATQVMTEAQTLLQEGKVQEAHDLIAAKLAEPKPEPPPPPPSGPQIVAAPIPKWVKDPEATAGLFDELLPLLSGLVAAAGNTPGLESRLARLRSLVAGLKKNQSPESSQSSSSTGLSED